MDGFREHIPKMTRRVMKDRMAFVAVGLLLTYIWRFHDLNGAIQKFRLAALFSVASWVLLMGALGSAPLRKAISRPYVLAAVAWFAWVAAGIPFALSPDQTTLFVTSTHYKDLLFFLFLATALGSLMRLKLLLFANVFGASVAAFYYVKGGMPLWGTPLPMYDVNDLALLLNMTLPMTVWAAANTKRPWERKLFWGAALLMVMSITGTRSRGGLLGLIATIGITMVRFKGVSGKVKSGLLVAIGVLLLIAPSAYWDRMSTILSLEEDYNTTSDVGRIAIWKRGLGYTKQNLFTGLGARNFGIAEGTLRVEATMGQSVKWSAAHNSYIQILAENGVVGFSCWILMILGSLWTLVRVRMRLMKMDSTEARATAQIADVLTTAFVAYLIGAVFLSQGYFPYLLVLVALTTGLQGQCERLAKEDRWERKRALHGQSAGVSPPLGTPARLR